MNYRALPDDRKEQFQEYVEYAFSLEEGPQDDYDWDPDDQPDEPRALFDGDRMLCVCSHNWFRTSLRGREFEMPGLSAVASPPEHRRQGNVARLLAESLAEYRERGDFLTALWAFEHPFYERQGWGIANKCGRYECAPEALSFARDSPLAGGEFRPVDRDEYDRLAPVLTAADEGYELTVQRTEEWWRKRVFSDWRGDAYVYGWERDGDIRGYVVYRVLDANEGKRLHVEELAAADREARLNCLRLLANHDSQVEQVSIYGPPETTLLDAAADPEAIDCEISAGPMVRLVDVPAAFEALEYPTDLDAEFSISVADPLAAWNDGTFRVAVADGRATCEPADEDRPDATAGVGALSQVYVGYHSVADAETFADIEVRDSGTRDALVAMFPEREVFLRETF
ncbi:GNAT family N-acetyltransferase [Halorussus caseinilyticus]|uniref:Enhanced intracellular survival protein Eis n=1 Tax=Halorussus caseinilyticus TaxID=3034025 RepID=A0ABD5WN17_9EURY|nr:GNAT family N-acetyltransferase [Halorussus sp. DT72]